MEYQELVGCLSVHSSAILAAQSFKELATKLLSLNREYQEVVNLLHTMAEEVISLHDMLGTLLLKVMNFNDHPPLNAININLECLGDRIEEFLTGYPFSMRKIDTEELVEIQNNIGYFRKIIDRFESNTLEDLPSDWESLSKPGSSSRSQFQRSKRWLHKWQHLFCIHAEYDQEDYTSLKDSHLSNFLRNKRLRIQVPEVRKDPEHLPDMPSKVECSRKASVRWEEVVIGLDEDITKIVDELTRPPSGLSLVTISGMGGIGKTTLAQNVFRHPKVVYHFHFTAWISSISNTDSALSRLLHSIKMTSDEIQEQNSDEDNGFDSPSSEIHGQSSEEKGQTLWRSLRGRKYLIVVDNLWSFDAWNAIEMYLPDDKVGSRILVTSRSMELHLLRSCRSLLKIPFQAFTDLELIDMHDCNKSAENSAKEFQKQFGHLKVVATYKKKVVEKGGRSFEYEY